MSRTTNVKISYGLFDKTAAEDGSMSMSDMQDFSDLTELVDEKSTIQKWMTLEDDGCTLDGSFVFLPENIADEFMGIWSKELSGEDGVFTNPPIFEVSFSEAHTSGGITLIFSEVTGDWCDSLHMVWLGINGEILSEKDFTPDKGCYFCENQVEDYYGLNITFSKTNLPNHFLKFTGIRYGVSMEIQGESLIKCSILEEIDPISSVLTINTLNFSFHTEKGEFDLLDLSGAFVLFQQRQSVQVTGRIDETEMNMGTFYLDKPTVNGNVVSMSCIDLIGVMDDTNYFGGYWPEGITAGALISDIFTSADITSDFYEIGPDLQEKTVYGYLPICSHRKALQQVAFALGAVVDCSRSEKVKIQTLTRTEAKTVPLERKIIGSSQENTSLVTGIEIFTHHYHLSNQATEILQEQMDPGEHLIEFSQPTTNLSISGATILKQGINFVRISVASATMVTISGYCYEDSTKLSGSVYLENLPANARANVKQITDCTLYSQPQSVAEQIFAQVQRRTKGTTSVLLSDEVAGDWLMLSSHTGKALTGIAEQINIDLTGGMIGKVVVCGE